MPRRKRAPQPAPDTRPTPRAPKPRLTDLTRDHELVQGVSSWFRAAARPLPWRTTPRDPYRSLVSELMLQQTQVARVLEKFEPFLVRFPSVESLANADERDVLAAWSGLGYYRRARLLHAAARAIVDLHASRIPDDLDDLLDLPGLGRYTAGAIASIVFGHAAPIVDANVARVFLRLEGKPLTAQKAMPWAWERAESLASHAHALGTVVSFNEGLMELGATVCTPQSPRCGSCPVASQCVARAQGTQDSIPRRKSKAVRTLLVCEVVVATDRLGRLLVERRPTHGMWGGLWQAPTFEHDGRAPIRALARSLGLPGTRLARPTFEFDHTTSHREVHFRIRRLTATKPNALLAPPRERRWVTREQAAELALSNPQRRILLEGR